MLIDTHSHLFLDEFKNDLPEVIQRAEECGVEKIFMPNIDFSSLPDLLDVCDCYKGYCYPMLGLHPTSVGPGYLDELETMKTSLRLVDLFVAIGEIGLDFHWDTTYKKEQLDALDIQVQWALKYRLPVVIHCRDAFDELYEALEPYMSSCLRGILHCFTGTPDVAKRFVDYPFFLFGVNGTVTYKNSALPEMLKACIPLERLVLETDSPYLSPVPNRGKRNETSYITEVQKKVAEIYGVSLETVGRITSKNAMDIFRIR